MGGIYGATSSAGPLTVLIGSDRKLGTINSSIRYKENVVDMNDSSDNILKLRPVKFNYKSDENKSMEFGLIAEEVEAVFPELVVYNDKKEPQSIKYHVFPALLLNELIKQKEEIRYLKSIICKD